MSIYCNKIYVNVALLKQEFLEHKHCNTKMVNLITETATKCINNKKILVWWQVPRGKSFQYTTALLFCFFLLFILSPHCV